MPYSTTVKSLDGIPITDAQPYLNSLIANMAVTIGSEAPPSTPSVMGHFLQFYNVVSSSGAQAALWGELYTKYVDEWCSIIAMLALSDTMDYHIEFQKIPFDQDNLFLSICNSPAIKPPLKPTNRTDSNIPDTSWDEIYNIIFDYDPATSTGNDVILGITHPWTLVCPAKSGLPNAAKNILATLAGDEYARRVVLQWITRMKNGNYNNTVMVLLRDFEQRLLALSGLPENTLVRAESEFRIKRPAFGKNIGDGGFGLINYTMHKRVKQSEWYALFTVLALNDIRSYNIVHDGMNFVQGRNPITINVETTIYAPVANTDFNFEFGYAKDTDNTLENNLTTLERVCLLGWLYRMQDNEWREDANELKLHLASLIEKLETKLNDEEQRTARDMLESKNRFYAISDKDPFCFTVHKHNAAFYDANAKEDLDEVAAKSYNNGKGRAVGLEVREGWFNALALLALKDIRGLDVGLYETNRVPAKSELEGCFIKNEANYVKYELRYDGNAIAYSSCATLIELIEGEERRVAGFIENLGLFEHEKILVACWLHRLNERIKNEGTLMDARIKDYDTLTKLIDERIKHILGKEKTIDTLKNSLFLGIGTGGYYTIKDAVPETGASANAATSCFDNINSSVKFFDHFITDNIFENKLMVAVDKIAEFDLKNKAGSSLVNQVYIIQANGKEAPLETEQFLLPFTDAFLSILHSKMYDANGKATAVVSNDFGNLEGFSLSSVKTICDTESDSYEVAFVGKGSLPDFEIKKRYTDAMVVRKAHNDVFGTAAVWPANEIHGLKGYKFTHIVSGEGKAKISIPSQVPTHEVKASNVDILKGDSYTMTAFKLKNFPKFIRFEHEGVQGILFTTPNDYIVNDGRSGRAVIGIDFGTSNTIVSIKEDGKIYPLKLSDVYGKLLTNGNIPSSHALPAFFQVPPKEGSTEFGDFFFPTTCMRIQSDALAEPLMNGNLYVFTVDQLLPNANSGGQTILESKRLVKEFKMSGSNENEMAVLFKQLIMAACVKVAEGSSRDISVHVSYPIALDRDVRDMYEKLWKKAMETSGKDLNFYVGNDLSLDDNVKFFSESYCAAQAPNACYESRPNSNNGYIVVDVGGGTTDIAVVKGGTHTDPSSIKAEMSAKYAARFIQRAYYLQKGEIKLSPFITPLLELRKDLMSMADAETKKSNEYKKLFGDANVAGDEGAIISLVNRLLNEYEGNHFTNQPMHDYSFDFERLVTSLDQAVKLCNKNDTIGTHIARLKQDENKFQSKAKLMSAALFFFIGSLMKKLEAKDVYSGGIKAVLMSGNGSRTFDWLQVDGDAKNSAEYLSKFYLMGLGADVNDASSISFSQSKAAKRKHETSEGLLEVNPNVGTDKPQQGSLLIPDLDGIFKHMKNEDIGDLKSALWDAFTGSGLPVPDFDSDARGDIEEAALKVVNPDYNEDSLKEEIFRFIKAFATISRSDYGALFEAPVYCDLPLDDAKNAKALAMVNDFYDTATNNDPNVSFPIKSANEYIVLMFAMNRLGDR